MPSPKTAQTEHRYRVVGIRPDGTRDVRSQNLFRATAEAVEAAMLESGEYQWVVIEVQPNSEAESGQNGAIPAG